MLHKFEHDYTFKEYKRNAISICLDFLDNHSQEKRAEVKKRFHGVKDFNQIDNIRNSIIDEAINNYVD